LWGRLVHVHYSCGVVERQLPYTSHAKYAIP
jgi:hypothetical protein